MLWNRSAGKIIFCLTNADFQFGDWRGFFGELKNLILPEDREYDPDDRQWYIAASEYNVSIIRQLEDKYFPSEG